MGRSYRLVGHGVSSRTRRQLARRRWAAVYGNAVARVSRNLKQQARGVQRARFRRKCAALGRRLTGFEVRSSLRVRWALAEDAAINLFLSISAPSPAPGTELIITHPRDE